MGAVRHHQALFLLVIGQRIQAIHGALDPGGVVFEGGGGGDGFDALHQAAAGFCSQHLLGALRQQAIPLVQDHLHLGEVVLRLSGSSTR